MRRSGGKPSPSEGFPGRISNTVLPKAPKSTWDFYFEKLKNSFRLSTTTPGFQPSGWRQWIPRSRSSVPPRAAPSRTTPSSWRPSVSQKFGQSEVSRRKKFNPTLKEKLILPGNTNWRERLSTVDLLIKVDYLAKKVNNVGNIKNSWSKLVSTRRSVVLVLPFSKDSLVKYRI